jgi:UDP-N-acetylmuramate--alanine ligase
MSFLDLSKINGRIHFIGIGGIGMSALAIILHQLGFKISGSDISYNKNIKKLENLGIKCFATQIADNIEDDISLIVKTSIIYDDNPEIIESKKRNIPIVRRADILSSILSNKKSITIAGTHGKTSTTTIISEIFEEADFDPTIINGGIINRFNSNGKFGKGQYAIAESDESDASFVDLPTFIGVVTNIEAEHMDFYQGDYKKYKSYFKQYINQIPENGLAVVNFDDKNIRDICHEIGKKSNIVTYSMSDNSDIMVENIKQDINGCYFDIVAKDYQIKDIFANFYGLHNISNAVAAIAVAKFVKIDKRSIKNALRNYQGVQRRFTKVGTYGEAIIIDDYAHHPTEIIAALQSAKQILSDKNKIITIFQPHKYSRTYDLLDDFAHSFTLSDILIIDDIHDVAGERKDLVNQDILIDKIKAAGHKIVLKLENKKDLANLVKKHISDGDIILCAGAGTITNMARNLEQDLKDLDG